jgi:hypothetical protein
MDLLCEPTTRKIYSRILRSRLGMSRKTRVILIGLLLLSLLPASSGRANPETGVIRMLHIGKSWLGPASPGPTFVMDPRISWMPVPAHTWSMGPEAERNLRVYMPRSRQELLDKYDVIVEDGMDARDMPARFMTWMIEEINSSGIGFLMADDSSSFATSGSHTSWYETPIGDILPVNDLQGIYGPRERFRCLPQLAGHPLTRDLPWGDVWISSSNKPWARGGATVIAEMSPTVPINRDKPYMSYWEVGAGISFAYVHKWHIDEGTFYRWPYHEDVLVHLIYFTAQERIPDDVFLEHRVRTKFSEVFQQRLYIISFIEFADKFGANLRRVETGLNDQSDLAKEARWSFIQADMEKTDTQLTLLAQNYEDLVSLAFDLWERAVFWVFLSEWLAVAGASMVAGYFLWTLMVKRKLYREVSGTRMRPMGR